MKKTDKNYEEFAAIQAGFWGKNSKMVDYCIKNADCVVDMADGLLYEIERPDIKKDFCFDDSYDYEGACEMAQHARTSQDYFRNENMAQVERQIEWWKELKERASLRYADDYNRPMFMAEHGGSDAQRAAIGDCLVFATLNGEHYRFNENDCLCRWITPEDCDRVLAALEGTKERFAKRVDAYLKRYGMDKVNSWHYWGDA